MLATLQIEKLYGSSYETLNERFSVIINDFIREKSGIGEINEFYEYVLYLYHKKSLANKNGSNANDYDKFFSLICILEEFQMNTDISINDLKKSLHEFRNYEQFKAEIKSYPVNLKPVDFHVISKFNKIGEKVLYLDQNILSPLINDSNLFNIAKEFCIAYSSEHVEEVYKSKQEYHENMLKRITEITNNLIILNINYKLELVHEEPRFSYKRVIKNLQATKVAENRRIIDQDDALIYFEEYRKIEHLSKVNNESVDVFRDFNTKIDKILKFKNRNYTVEQLKNKKKINTCAELNSKIHDLYYALDILGYKRDKNEKKIRSGRHDIEHLVNATVADYFATNDENFKLRAKAIFEILKIDTVVLNLNELKQITNT